MSLQKKSKWILALLAIVIVGAFGVYKYTYKSHKTTEDLKADLKAAFKVVQETLLVQ